MLALAVVMNTCTCFTRHAQGEASNFVAVLLKIHSGVCAPKIIRIERDLTKLWENKNAAVFFCPTVYKRQYEVSDKHYHCRWHDWSSVIISAGRPVSKNAACTYCYNESKPLDRDRSRAHMDWRTRTIHRHVWKLLCYKHVVKFHIENGISEDLNLHSVKGSNWFTNTF